MRGDAGRRSSHAGRGPVDHGMALSTAASSASGAGRPKPIRLKAAKRSCTRRARWRVCVAREVAGRPQAEGAKAHLDRVASSRLPQALVHRQHQLFRIDRLAEYAREVAAIQIADVHTRDHNDRNAAGFCVRHELLLDIAPAQPSESKVENDRIRHESLNRSQRIDPVFDGDHRIARSHERVSIQFTDGGSSSTTRTVVLWGEGDTDRDFTAVFLPESSTAGVHPLFIKVSTPTEAGGVAPLSTPSAVATNQHPCSCILAEYLRHLRSVSGAAL